MIAILSIVAGTSCKPRNISSEHSEPKQIASDVSPRLGEGQHYLYLVKGPENNKSLVRKLCANELQQDGVEAAYANYEAACGNAGTMPFEAFSFNVKKQYEAANSTTFEDWDNWQDLVGKLRTDQKRYNLTSNGTAFPQFRKFIKFFDPVVDEYVKTNKLPFAPDLLADKSNIICKKADHSGKSRRIDVVPTNGEMINGVKSTCKTVLTNEDGSQQRIGWASNGGLFSCNNSAFKYVVSLTESGEYSCE